MYVEDSVGCKIVEYIYTLYCRGPALIYIKSIMKPFSCLEQIFLVDIVRRQTHFD